MLIVEKIPSILS